MLGDRSAETAAQLGAQIPQGPEIAYVTDFWHPYRQIFPPDRHQKGKAYTYTIESMNNKLRCYLARLHRKTHCYSKSVANLNASLLFCFVRKFDAILIIST